MEMPQLHQPVPRRHFEITPASEDSSHHPSPSPENVNPELLMERRQQPGISPSRTRSILNLTSSTLFGIYSNTGSDGTPQEMSTPWGTGAQTPSHRKSMDDCDPEKPWTTRATNTSNFQTASRRRRAGFRGFYLPLALQTALLFGFGVGYGYLVNQLHEKGNITPVPVHVVDRNSSFYHLSWGMFGVLLGNGLPLLDRFWYSDSSVSAGSGVQQARPRTPDGGDSGLNPLWYSAVRSIGAFVGIAFAVRRLPWTSTLQVSLTLALANPVLWYLIDRSMPGFAFSSFIGVMGTSILLIVNPKFVPVPTIHQDLASENVGVYTWLTSILFCTSLCFGAIGRKLQL